MTIRNRTLTAAVLVLALARAGAAQVAITGGREGQTNTYTWTLVNHGTKPVVRFEFPRHMVKFPTPPENWKGEVVSQTPEGRILEPQVVVFQAESDEYAIRPGQNASFSVLVTTDRAAPSRREVTIGYADGTTETIGNVEIPWDLPWLEKHALLIGMGTLFAVFLLVQILRGRRKGQGHR